MSGLIEQRKGDAQVTDPHWIESAVAMLTGLAQEWQGKMALGAIVTSICELMHIDEVLLYICFFMLTADMISRTIVLTKRDRSMCRGLKRAIPRYCFYLLFIILAWTVQFAVFRSLNVDIPVTNLVIAYLILTDCASVIGHLVYLGVPVPALIKTIVVGSKKKVEKTAKTALDIDENEEESDTEKPASTKKE